MGYACPVCGDPQADARHLANHLAFTAITSGGDHEAWLDERVPGWGERGEAALAEAVVDDAEETEYPRVFEAGDGSGGGPDGESGHAYPGGGGADGDGERRRDGVDLAAARERGRGEVDEATRAAVEEAREMTRQRFEDDDRGGASGDSNDEHGGTDGGTESEADEASGPGSETE